MNSDISSVTVSREAWWFLGAVVVVGGCGLWWWSGIENRKQRSLDIQWRRGLILAAVTAITSIAAPVLQVVFL
jgi:hypothetical protein